MKKRTSEQFVKSLPKLDGKKRASRHLQTTIKAVNGERPIEDALIMPPKGEKLKLTPLTKSDKFWGWFYKNPWGTWLSLGLLTLFVIAVAYWGIKQ